MALLNNVMFNTMNLGWEGLEVGSWNGGKGGR